MSFLRFFADAAGRKGGFAGLIAFRLFPKLIHFSKLREKVVRVILLRASLAQAKYGRREFKGVAEIQTLVNRGPILEQGFRIDQNMDAAFFVWNVEYLPVASCRS